MAINNISEDCGILLTAPWRSVEEKLRDFDVLYGEDLDFYDGPVITRARASELAASAYNAHNGTSEEDYAVRTLALKCMNYLMLTTREEFKQGEILARVGVYL